MTTPVRSSSDSKVAIKRCLKVYLHETLPQVWSTSSAQRELLQLSWAKGHLDATQHCQRFGLENWWMWATNLEADLACSRKSAEVFSHQQANRTDCIDQAARAKFDGRRSALSRRQLRWGLPDHFWLFEPFQNICGNLEVHISLLTTRSLGSKKLSSKQRQSRAGKAKPSGPNKRQRLLASSAASAGIHPSHLTLNLELFQVQRPPLVRTRVKGPRGPAAFSSAQAFQCSGFCCFICW